MELARDLFSYPQLENVRIQDIDDFARVARDEQELGFWLSCRGERPINVSNLLDVLSYGSELDDPLYQNLLDLTRFALEAIPDTASQVMFPECGRRFLEASLRPILRETAGFEQVKTHVEGKSRDLRLLDRAGKRLAAIRGSEYNQHSDWTVLSVILSQSLESDTLDIDFLLSTMAACSIEEGAKGLRSGSGTHKGTESALLEHCRNVGRLLAEAAFLRTRPESTIMSE